jgi:hypothetical protein
MLQKFRADSEEPTKDVVLCGCSNKVHPVSRSTVLLPMHNSPAVHYPPESHAGPPSARVKSKAGRWQGPSCSIASNVQVQCPGPVSRSSVQVQCPGPPSSCQCITRLLCITHPRATPGLLAPESRAKPVGGKVHHALLHLMSSSRSRSRSRSAIPCRTFPPLCQIPSHQNWPHRFRVGRQEESVIPCSIHIPTPFPQISSREVHTRPKCHPSNTESPNWPHRFRVGNQEKSVMPCSIRG